MIKESRNSYIKDIFLVLFILFVQSCSPKVIVTQSLSSNPYNPTKVYESFAIIESDSITLDDQVLIAEIQIKEKGFTVNCDYDSVKRLAAHKAKEMGGNCLYITEHKTPDNKSTCHRIKANVLKISDPQKYETEISWHLKRRLKIENFKANTDKRPFQAATYSMIRYYASSSIISGKPKAYIQSVFNSDLSYFKRSDHDAYVLHHEQLHFDITEIYARKFRKIIIENNLSFIEFSDQHNSIFTKIQEELALKQDEYDSEVYEDRTLQDKWNDWVKSELKKYEEYANPEIVFGKK